MCIRDRTHQITSNYRLADVAPKLVTRFRDLGRKYAASPDDTLRRTEVIARVETGADGVTRTVVATQAASDVVLSTEHEAVSSGQIIHHLERAILHSSVSTGRREDRQPARILAEAVVDGAAQEAEVLGRYLDQLGGAVVRELGRAVSDGAGHVETVSDIRLLPIDWFRSRAEITLSDHHSEFNRRLGYAGWQRSLYDEARFDSSTERDLAVLLDTSPTEVELWVRLMANDLAINWTGTGQTYHPDFLVAEPAVERHGRLIRPCWVVEAKADRDVGDPDVLAKHEAAVTWAARVNADGKAAPDEWHVLLASESAIKDAKGSWKRLKQLGSVD